MARKQITMYLEEDLIQRIRDLGLGISATVDASLEYFISFAIDNEPVEESLRKVDEDIDHIQNMIVKLKNRIDDYNLILNEHISKRETIVRLYDPSNNSVRESNLRRQINSIIIKHQYNEAKIAEETVSLVSELMLIDTSFNLHVHVSRMRFMMEGY